MNKKGENTMESYEHLEMEVIIFETSDVITNSDTTTEEG